MSSNTSSTIGTILIGVAIGFGLGVLFAPDKGSETQKKLKKRFDEEKEDLSEKLDDFLDEVLDTASHVKSKAKDTVNHVEKTTEEMIAILEQKLTSLKSAQNKGEG